MYLLPVKQQEEPLQEEYNNMSISVLWKWVLDPGYLPVMCIYLYRISYRLLLRAVCLVLENELRKAISGSQCGHISVLSLSFESQF